MPAGSGENDTDLGLSDKSCALLMLNKDERKLFKELLIMSMHSASIRDYIEKKLGRKYLMLGEKLLKTLQG